MKKNLIISAFLFIGIAVSTYFNFGTASSQNSILSLLSIKKAEAEDTNRGKGAQQSKQCTASGSYQVLVYDWTVSNGMGASATVTTATTTPPTVSGWFSSVTYKGCHYETKSWTAQGNEYTCSGTSGDCMMRPCDAKAPSGY
jgi:hypothetical protein